MIVILHIPLFTKWLKTVRDAGARVLMVIDSPEMLESLMSPPDSVRLFGIAWALQPLERWARPYISERGQR
jgi:hypothetical protein